MGECIMARVAIMPASKGSRSSSKKAKKGGSNVFDMFTQKQVAEFKEGFQIMDRDRDGIINKVDLRGVFDEIGRMSTESELDEMLADAPGPINFTTLLHMFASRSSGESDDDDVVAAAIRAFEKSPGQIDAENFKSMLMAFGDKFTKEEVAAAFEQMEYDEDTGIIDGDALVGMLCASSGKEEPAAQVPNFISLCPRPKEMWVSSSGKFLQVQELLPLAVTLKRFLVNLSTAWTLLLLLLLHFIMYHEKKHRRFSSFSSRYLWPSLSSSNSTHISYGTAG